MIGMSTKQSIIIRYFRQGESKRKISRELGIHRNTVDRYIKEYEQGRQKETGKKDLEQEELHETILHPPRYDSSKRTRRKLTKEIIEQIDQYLAKNAIKRSSGRSKQVMKKVDVWEALVAADYDISYPSVCNYIRSKEWKKEAYIRQSYTPGSVCEFDWGEVKLIIGGIKRVYQLAVFTMAWSNYRYAYLYNRQHAQSFHQSHVRFFEHLAGVPGQMVYDNMRVAVKRFVGRTEKEATQGLLSMSMYYQFAFRFCNVRKGNEKGHVERSVEYVRRKAFSVLDEFEDLPSANTHLLKIVRGLNEKEQQQKGTSAVAQLKQARPYLALCPASPMECAEIKNVKVDKYSTICVYQNHYSVPEILVGKIVQVKIYSDHLLIYYKNEVLCKHERHYTCHEWYLNLDHYLSTLLRKPGALKGAQALEQADTNLKRIYQVHFQGRSREFIELLHYQRQKKLSLFQIQQVIHKLLQMGCKEISLDKIKVSLEHAPVQEQVPKDGQIEQLAKEQLQQVANLFSKN